MELPLLMYQRSSCERESTAESEIDAGAEDGEELGKPRGMRGPGGTGDEVAVSDGLGHGEIDVGASSESNFRAGGGVGAALFHLENPSGGENLRAVAEGSDGFVCF